jgi:hypothetical protein
MPDQIAIQRGRDFEDCVSILLDLKKQPGSGNKFYAKNDCTGNSLSVSCKSQQKFTWTEILNYLDQSIEDANGTGNIPALALEDRSRAQIIVMRITDFSKAFAEGIKIPEVYESKGVQKRKEIETPLMLRE